MSLKHLLVTLSGATLLAAAPIGAATAEPPAPGPVRGPSCTVITGGTGTYLHDELSSRLAVDGSPCQSITYSLVALEHSGGKEIARLTSSTFDDAGNILFSGTVSEPDNEICVYVETSAGKHVFDRSPNVGCIVTTDDVDGGAGGFTSR